MLLRINYNENKVRSDNIFEVALGLTNSHEAIGRG